VNLTKSAINKIRQNQIPKAYQEFSQSIKILGKSEVGHFSEFELDEARFGKVLASYYLGNHKDAESEANACLKDFRHKQLVHPQLSALQLLVEIYIELEKYDLALTFISEANEILARTLIPQMQLAFKLYNIIILARQKQIARANELLETIEEEFAEEIDFHLPDGLAEAKAEIALVQEKQTEALSFFESAISLNEDCKYSKMMYYHRVSLIAGLDVPKAETYHLRAVRLAKELELPQREDLFRDKFAKFQTRPHSITVTQPISDKIQIFGFGAYQVQLPGTSEPLSKKDWKSEKARKLLLYLLLHEQPRRVKDSIIDALWSENDEKKLTNTFHATLSTLRRALNDPNVILHHDGFYGVNTSAVEVDWILFKQEINSATEAKRQARIEAACSGFQRARAIYKGRFVPEFENDRWVVESRDYFERIYKEGCTDLAELLVIEEEDYQQALSIMDDMLQLDLFDERVYDKAIQYAGMLKNYQRAKEYYQSYKTMMHEEFNMPPSNAIERTYRQYVSQNHHYIAERR